MVEILLALIVTLTGIVRPVDPELTSMAQHRVIEIQSNFSHDGFIPGTAEILGKNSGMTNPINSIVEGWLGSSTHRAILLDPYWARIGCDIEISDNTYWFVCLFWPADGQPLEPTHIPAPVEPPPQVLSDTSVAWPSADH